MHQEWQGLRWHGGSSEIKQSINGSAPMGGQLTNDEDSDGDGGAKAQPGQDFFFLDRESARLQTHCDNCLYSRNKVSALRAER